MDNASLNGDLFLKIKRLGEGKGVKEEVLHFSWQTQFLNTRGGNRMILWLSRRLKVDNNSELFFFGAKRRGSNQLLKESEHNGDREDSVGATHSSLALTP